MKYQLLKNDYKTFPHPTKNGKMVRVFRVFYLRDVICGDYVIRGGQSGGFVESESCLSQEDNSIVANNAVIFENPIIENSVVKDDAKVWDSIFVKNSTISGHSRLWGMGTVVDSRISDAAFVHLQNAGSITETDIANSVRVKGYVQISKSKLSNGAGVRDNAIVETCVLSDVSEVSGNSIVKNCRFSGRYVCKNENIENATLSREIELNVTQGPGDPGYKKW